MTASSSSNTTIQKMTFEGLSVSGLSVRTKNTNEMNPDTAKIKPLYERFNQQVTVDYASGAKLYGVYHAYESDHTEEFSLLVGSTPEALTTEASVESIALPAGKYLVFSKTGEMPQAVIDVWGEIWGYFGDESPYQRAYTVDFECYTGPDSVDVYVAVL